MFQTKVVEKVKTHILCSITFFFFENRAVYEIMWEKCGTAGYTTDDNTARAHCMLDTEGYRHTLRICNIYCFTTATMVKRRRLNVTFIRQLPVLFISSNATIHKAFGISKDTAEFPGLSLRHDRPFCRPQDVPLPTYVRQTRTACAFTSCPLIFTPF